MLFSQTSIKCEYYSPPGESEDRSGVYNAEFLVDSNRVASCLKSYTCLVELRRL